MFKYPFRKFTYIFTLFLFSYPFLSFRLLRRLPGRSVQASLCRRRRLWLTVAKIGPNAPAMPLQYPCDIPAMPCDPRPAMPSRCAFGALMPLAMPSRVPAGGWAACSKKRADVGKSDVGAQSYRAIFSCCPVSPVWRDVTPPGSWCSLRLVVLFPGLRCSLRFAISVPACTLAVRPLPDGHYPLP